MIVLDHLKPAFNIGKIFRSADAFGAREVHLVGIDFFDPAPAMGSFKWVPARFHSDIGSWLYFVHIRADGEICLTAVKMPKRSAFILGHEEFGLSFDRQDFDGIKSLSVPQFGKVESLNVSNAASIIMYEYVRQHSSLHRSSWDVA